MADTALDRGRQAKRKVPSREETPKLAPQNEVIYRRPPFYMRAGDLRATLGVTAAALSQSIKKIAATLPDGERLVQRKGALTLLDPDLVRAILIDRGLSYPESALVFAIMICKGGAGKTAVSLYLATRLSSYGCRILLVDADPQGNLTQSFYLDDIGENTKVLNNIIGTSKPIRDIIIPVTKNLHLVPSTLVNSSLDDKLAKATIDFKSAIRTKIDAVRQDYDFVLIDCAPALSYTNYSAAAAADLMVLPVNPDEYSKIGLGQTLDSVEAVEEGRGFKVPKKIIFNKFDAREYTSVRYLQEVTAGRKEQMFSTLIRTSADVKNAVSKKQDLFLDTRSTAREDFDALAKEILGINGLNLRKRR